MNVAAIASRTGIARTTIYRRYRDREELLAQALRQVTVRGAPAADLPVAAKLRWVLDRAEEVLEHGIGLGGVAAVLAGNDDDLTAAMRRALEDGLRPVRDEVVADVASGRLPPGLDADSLLMTVLGAYLARALLHGTPVDPCWKDDLVELLRASVGEGSQPATGGAEGSAEDAG